MGKNSNRNVSFTLLITALASATVAYAQEQDTSSKIEEVIVTSEMIDRSLSRSGLSVDIFDEDTLRNQGVLTTLRDILDSSTNLSMMTGTGKAPTVRGIDGTGASENAIAFFSGSRARLSWQIDGRPASYNEIVFGDMGIYDVERIEVLRGAQSSLIGPNAIAGSMVVKTKDPVFDFEGSAQLAGGNFDQRRSSGMLNFPIVDEKLAFRIAADIYQRDNATEYEPYEGVDKPEQMEAIAVRAKALFQPTGDKDTRLLMTLSHTKYEGPQGEIIVRPFEDRVSNAPNQPVHKPTTTSLIGDFAMPLSDSMKFEVISSITDMEFVRESTSSAGRIETTEKTFEPRLRYSNDNGTSAVFGLYYHSADQDERIEFGPAGTLVFDQSTETLAVYTEGLIPLSATLDLSLGIRYEQEDRERVGGDADLVFVQISANENYEAFLPKVGLNWKPQENLSFGAQISRGYSSGGSGVSFVSPVVNFEYEKETVWTGELFSRQDFMGGRLQTKQNIFYSLYNDMQLPFDLTPENSRDESFVIRNADEVRTIGAELGLTLSTSEHTNVFGNIGLLETEITDYEGSGVEGNELLTAPNFSANTGFTLVRDNFNASVVARYSDAYFTDVNNRPRGKTDAYVVADAQAGYDFGNIRIFANIKNMFDNETSVARYPGFNTAIGEDDASLDTAVLLQPRTYTVGLQLDF